MYMLDTNVVINILRNPRGTAAAKLAQISDSEVAVSIVVAAELQFLVRKRKAVTLSRLVDEFLNRIAVLPVEAPADAHYGQLRATFEQAGPIAGAPESHNDLFIAAHALALDATLVTDNEREFSRVKGLKVENWLR
jgi:tRNA(fMet)-specific endonuclease VapC